MIIIMQVFLEVQISTVKHIIIHFSKLKGKVSWYSVNLRFYITYSEFILSISKQLLKGFFYSYILICQIYVSKLHKKSLSLVINKNVLSMILATELKIVVYVAVT